MNKSPLLEKKLFYAIVINTLRIIPIILQEHS